MGGLLLRGGREEEVGEGRGPTYKGRGGSAGRGLLIRGTKGRDGKGGEGYSPKIKISRINTASRRGGGKV